MALQDIIFWKYMGILLHLLMAFVWGWGALYTLAKITKYRNMLIGTVGCLGMFAINLGEILQQLPYTVFLCAEQFEVVYHKSQWIHDFLSRPYRWEALQIALQIFIVAALAGTLRRPKQKEGEITPKTKQKPIAKPKEKLVKLEKPLESLSEKQLPQAKITSPLAHKRKEEIDSLKDEETLYDYRVIKEFQEREPEEFNVTMLDQETTKSHEEHLLQTPEDGGDEWTAVETAKSTQESEISKEEKCDIEEKSEGKYEPEEEPEKEFTVKRKPGFEPDEEPEEKNDFDEEPEEEFTVRREPDYDSDEEPEEEYDPDEEPEEEYDPDEEPEQEYDPDEEPEEEYDPNEEPDEEPEEEFGLGEEQDKEEYRIENEPEEELEDDKNYGQSEEDESAKKTFEQQSKLNFSKKSSNGLGVQGTGKKSVPREEGGSLLRGLVPNDHKSEPKQLKMKKFKPSSEEE